MNRDVDWEDSDALFHLGVVEMRRAEAFVGRGERRAAERSQRRGLRAFKVCLAHDDRKKWRGEIAHEQARAKQKPVRLPKPTRRIGTDSSSEHPSSLNLMRPSSSGRVPIPKTDTSQQEKAR